MIREVDERIQVRSRGGRVISTEYHPMHRHACAQIDTRSDYRLTSEY